MWEIGTITITSLLNLVVLSSNHCLVPVHFSIIVTTYLINITLLFLLAICRSHIKVVRLLQS